jgi:formylglycine-generating enzyme required for sulfatase activity
MDNIKKHISGIIFPTLCIMAAIFWHCTEIPDYDEWIRRNPGGGGGGGDGGAINAEDTAMVFVEGGTFTMGCTTEQGSDCWSDESPTSSVTLSSYYIGKYEVTQRWWKEIMGSNPSYFTGDARPVERVSWNDVQEFITVLNQRTGKTYRLPTEAEWEYAARGGNKSNGYKYSGSNTIGNVAWYSSNSGSSTKPVGGKSANELGIHDMSGNVWEWVNDWYESYSSEAKDNPTGPASGSYRVYRGGSWLFVARFCRVSFRYNFDPEFRDGNLGFRLVLSP